MSEPQVFVLHMRVKRSSPSSRFFSHFEASRAKRRHILEMGPQEMKFPSALKYLNPVRFSFHPANPSAPPTHPTDNKSLFHLFALSPQYKRKNVQLLVWCKILLQGAFSTAGVHQRHPLKTQVELLVLNLCPQNRKMQ